MATCQVAPTPTPSASQQVCSRCVALPVLETGRASHDNHNQTHTPQPHGAQSKAGSRNLPAGHWSWDHTATLSSNSSLKCQLSSKASGSHCLCPLKIPFLSLLSVFSPLPWPKRSLIVCGFASFALLLLRPFDLAVALPRSWAHCLLTFHCSLQGPAHSRPSAKSLPNERTNQDSVETSGRTRAGIWAAALNHASVFKYFCFIYQKIKVVSSGNTSKLAALKQGRKWYFVAIKQKPWEDFKYCDPW